MTARLSSPARHARCRTATFAVLEVGGSHVTGGVVDLDRGRPPRLPRGCRSTPAERPTRSSPRCSRWAAGSAPRPARCGPSAFPGPFDYDTGIGRFTASASSTPCSTSTCARPWPPASAAARLALRQRRGRLRPRRLGRGSAAGPAGLPHPRYGRRLGVRRRRGRVRSGPTVPPDAEMHLTSWHGKPLEDTVVAPGDRRAYAAATGVDLPGVREVVERSRAGDAAAAAALRTAFVSLGRAWPRG